MRGLSNRFPRARLPRIAVAALLPVVLLSATISSDVPDFSGVWVEIQPDSAPLLRLQLIQSGLKVQIRASRRDTFSDSVFGVGTIENGIVTWSGREGCVERFQWSGYNYDNPGVDMYSLSLRSATGPLLVLYARNPLERALRRQSSNRHRARSVDTETR
jgi:hypothetical protein